MRVTGAQLEDFDWIRERAQCGLTPNAKAIKAVTDDGRIVGMVAYDNWTHNSVECHMAADSPIAWRKLLWPAFSYPFEQEGMGIILGIMPASNERSQGLVRRFGFNEAYRVKDGWAVGDDLVVFEMRKENCRWLTSRLGAI